MPLIAVSEPVKARIDQLQAERRAKLDRMVTASEVIEVLLAEHDQAEASQREANHS